MLRFAIAFFSLFAMVAAISDTAEGESKRSNLRAIQAMNCQGYFCDKKVTDIIITMTHNSLATPGQVLSPNQNKDLDAQFEDGIRGFNFDLYDDGNGVVYTKHGATLSTDPYPRFKKLIEKMNASPSEFVLIQLEDYMTVTGRKAFVDYFGTLVIKDFDISKPLGTYINQGKRILMVTDKSSISDLVPGIYRTSDYITENGYEWKDRYGTPSMAYRRGPTSGPAIKLMNAFCSLTGMGDMVTSSEVNVASRILYNARLFKKQTYAQDKINVIMVDYYETGKVFDAETSIRNGDFMAGCWKDAQLCGKGTTCYSCCNGDQYWYGKAYNACGIEPKWSDGSICAAGTTCKACQNPSTYWSSKAITACGTEPKWDDGTICALGTTCNQCKNAATFWNSKFITACGKENCWGGGTVCGKGTTCNSCCTGNSNANSCFIGICKCG